MHSNELPPSEIIGREQVDHFVTAESYVAIAANQSSNDSVWFAIYPNAFE